MIIFKIKIYKGWIEKLNGTNTFKLSHINLPVYKIIFWKYWINIIVF